MRAKRDRTRERRYTLQLTSNWPEDGRTFWLSPLRDRDELSPDLVAYANLEAPDKEAALTAARALIAQLQEDERNHPERLARISAPLQWDGSR